MGYSFWKQQVMSLKTAFLIAVIIFLSINTVNAKDIQPIKHNEFGETTLAIDLDSIKPCSNGTYTVEILSLANENWHLNDQIFIAKTEIDINNKQHRTVETYSRYRKNWKIANIGNSNTSLAEQGNLKWQKIDKESPIERIYMITYIIGEYGKKYYIDGLLSK